MFSPQSMKFELSPEAKTANEGVTIKMDHLRITRQIRISQCKSVLI